MQISAVRALKQRNGKWSKTALVLTRDSQEARQAGAEEATEEEQVEGESTERSHGAPGPLQRRCLLLEERQDSSEGHRTSSCLTRTTLLLYGGDWVREQG